MKVITTILSIFIGSSLLLTNFVHADEIIQYNDSGNILGRLQCDKVTVHDSSHQSTLICAKTPKVDLRVGFVPLRTDSEYRSCLRNQGCVIIDNKDDPSWRPIALRGIPKATFGRNARGNSCVRIRETKPRFTSWDRDVWNLCTTDPQIELAYTYSDGYKNDNIEKRFKRRNVRKVCFSEILRDYQYREFWTDNCIFVRQK